MMIDHIGVEMLTSFLSRNPISVMAVKAISDPEVMGIDIFNKVCKRRVEENL